MVIFAENLNGPFSGIGAADVHAGFDIKVGIPVGFLPGMVEDTGEQAHRRFEDRLSTLIINACLDTVTLEVSVGVEDVRRTGGELESLPFPGAEQLNGLEAQINARYLQLRFLRLEEELVPQVGGLMEEARPR